MSSVPAVTDRAALAAIAEQGRALILSLQDAGGAYPASPTFSAYQGYAWFRDGAFIADGMSAAGEIDSAAAFFGWCGRAMLARRDDVARIVAAASAGAPVPDQEMLPTRLLLERRGGRTRLVGLPARRLRHLALGRGRARRASRHRPSSPGARRSRSPSTTWSRPGTAPAMTGGRSTSSRSTSRRSAASSPGCGRQFARGRSTPTGARGLRLRRMMPTASIVERGVVDGHLVKWIGSPEVDASLAALSGAARRRRREQSARAGQRLRTRSPARRRRRRAPLPRRHLLRWRTVAAAQLHPRSRLVCRGGSGACPRAAAPGRAATVRESGTMPEQVDDHLLDAVIRRRMGRALGVVCRPAALVVRDVPPARGRIGRDRRGPR